MQAAWDHADPDWRAAAVRVVRRMAISKAKFIVDDVWPPLLRGGYHTHEPRAIGPVLGLAKKLGWIVKRGSEPGARSGRDVATWFSLLRRAARDRIERAQAVILSYPQDLTEREIEAFWNQVCVEGPNDCWPWYGPTDRFGFGLFRARGRDYSAASVSASLYYDPLDASVLPHCGNRACCNPRHLYYEVIEE